MPSSLLKKLIPHRKKDPSTSPESLVDESEKDSRSSSSGNGVDNKDILLAEQARRIQIRRAQSSAVAQVKETDTQRELYGELWWEDVDSTGEASISELSNLVGQTVDMRVRLHTVRAVSSALVFLVLRQGMDTVQGVLHADEAVTTHMVRWVSRLEEETILHVRGVVQKPQVQDGQVRRASVHDVELDLLQVHVIVKVAEPVPFSVYEADLSASKDTEEDSDSEDGPHISDRARLNSRIIHLRSAAAQAVFRIQSTVSTQFRVYLTTLSQGEGGDPSLDFIEIHTPRLQPGASESGADAVPNLAAAQSPQLNKQMSVSAGFERVLEVGPVFRAENSNTHRHLTEYTGLDLEMSIRGGGDAKGWHEVMYTVDSTLKSIFKAVYTSRRRELELVKEQFPSEDLVWLEETLVIKFPDGVQMLIDDGWTDEEGNPPKKDEDLNTRAEIRLGQLIKQKYATDYYILDLFPKSARPFYTMPAPRAVLEQDIWKRHPELEGTVFTCSFDIFVRGQEITTGGQRIHDYEMLVNAMGEGDISERGLEEYLDAFRWGAPPHGGAGIGLERLVMLILGLGDIRYASMYPRDPKSLPETPKSLQGLPHPEATIDASGSTFTSPDASRFSLQGQGMREMQGLSDLSLPSGGASGGSSGSSTPVPVPNGNATPAGTSPHQGGAETPISTTTGATAGSTATGASGQSKVKHPPHHVGPSPLSQSHVVGSEAKDVGGSGVALPGLVGGGGGRGVPPLPKLIANYGDAANTSWLDDRYLLWRDAVTGGAIGFVPSSGFAIIVGDPLCDRSQFAGVVGRFLGWLRRGEKGEKGDEGHNQLGFIERKMISSVPSDADDDDKEKKEERKVEKTDTSLSTTIASVLASMKPGKGSDEELVKPSNTFDTTHTANSVITAPTAIGSTQTFTSAGGTEGHLAHPKPLGPLKPIWLLASAHLESVLGSRMAWSSFTCIAESRVELEGEVPAALEEKEVSRKVRKARGDGGAGASASMLATPSTDPVMTPEDVKEGIRVVGSGGSGNPMPLSLKHVIDARIKEWRDGRRKKGGQVRLTEVDPWRDWEHRQYFVALAPRKSVNDSDSMDSPSDSPSSKDEKIPVSLVVLHQLSPVHGVQVKYALDFPPTSAFPTISTSGAIESALSAAMHAVASTGSGRLTFGTSATSRLTPVRNVKGVRVKVLSHAYEAISERMNLRGKGEFRRKMGAEEDDVYICYPKGGMGTKGAKAVLDFVVAES
ncbi:hypothetical protein BDP27DRAFT_1421233 [Rhodocollybia butyracea]|uniref:aspartate--tRNA ligase n=1 Tax=Rhodocollybia butyracea TaxID=206335 RepID=A0A9P5PTX8_9AGAR|nr:hypothetical protein BDP27DRAFT_1421233 [Rhodocollybia butyracea]